MKNETYLMVNGQKIELTDEQKKQLGIIEAKKSCFDRVPYGETYYAIKPSGKVSCYTDVCDGFDDSMYSVANYCTDGELMSQRALHETLNRLLFRYSMTHDGDKINWSDSTITKWYIVYSSINERFYVDYNTSWKTDGAIYFHTESTALKAIEEIVKPFIKEHPEFVW